MISDSQLQRDVIAELAWEPSIDATKLGVSVEKGGVTLFGHVTSLAQKQAAEAAGRRVKGVRALAEEIEVRLPESRKWHDDEIAKRAADVLLWHSPDLVERIVITVAAGVITLAGALGSHQERVRAEQDVRRLSGVRHVDNALTIRAAADPPDIRDKIVRALERSADLEAQSIIVASLGTTVILTGRLRSCQERQLAEHIAWAAPGVTEVQNRIVVAA
jgi:osmotically-inducible protein OsmY